VIIEWNHHLWHTDTDAYPVDPGARYDPRPISERGSADPVGDYLDRLDEVGVDRAVVVQPEPYLGDHQLVIDAVREAPDRLRAVSLFHPRNPDAPGELEALVEDHPETFVATRFHSDEHYMDRFDDDGVRAIWDRAAGLGQIVELHLSPSWASGVAGAIDDYPDTPVVIDHLSEPHHGDAVEYADVLALAERDNVYMKLSALDHFASDPPLYESARTFTRWVVDAFGPDRMVWGKGTPEIVDTHLAGYSDADRAQVRGDNLAELVWGE
jgi:predicted TIM-barrel fold metal-dependent hydrolase